MNLAYSQAQNLGYQPETTISVKNLVYEQSPDVTLLAGTGDCAPWVIV